MSMIRMIYSPHITYDRVVQSWKTKNPWNINYINKKWSFDNIWQNPKLDINRYVRIIYNDNLKSIARIKRIIYKIDSQLFQLKKVLQNAYMQLVLMYEIQNEFSKELNKLNTSKRTNLINDFIRDVNVLIEEYTNYYNILGTYYNNLPKYKKKYLNRIKVLKGEDICSQCFIETNRFIKNKKNKICHECNDKNINKCDCPICMDTFSELGMTKINCGNGHQTCSICYQILRKYSNKCPICRGVL